MIFFLTVLPCIVSARLSFVWSNPAVNELKQAQEAQLKFDIATLSTETSMLEAIENLHNRLLLAESAIEASRESFWFSFASKLALLYVFGKVFEVLLKRFGVQRIGDKDEAELKGLQESKISRAAYC